MINNKFKKFMTVSAAVALSAAGLTACSEGEGAEESTDTNVEQTEEGAEEGAEGAEEGAEDEEGADEAK